MSNDSKLENKVSDFDLYLLSSSHNIMFKKKC